MRAAIFSARRDVDVGHDDRALTRANRSARARPIPCPPPVTTTHRPSSSIGHLVGLDPEDLEHHTADLGEEVAGAALAGLRVEAVSVHGMPARARHARGPARGCGCRRPPPRSRPGRSSGSGPAGSPLNPRSPQRSAPRKSTTLSIVNSPAAFACGATAYQPAGGAPDDGPIDHPAGTSNTSVRNASTASGSGDRILT